MKELSKSVDSWWSYHKKFDTTFLLRLSVVLFYTAEWDRGTGVIILRALTLPALAFVYRRRMVLEFRLETPGISTSTSLNDSLPPEGQEFSLNFLTTILTSCFSCHPQSDDWRRFFSCHSPACSSKFICMGPFCDGALLPPSGPLPVSGGNFGVVCAGSARNLSFRKQSTHVEGKRVSSVQPLHGCRTAYQHQLGLRLHWASSVVSWRHSWTDRASVT